MFLEELVPRNDYTKYIPSFINDDSVTPEAISALGPYLHEQKKSPYQTLGFISGAATLQRILNENHHQEGEIPKGGNKKDIQEKGATSTWFSTDEVVEVRTLFRSSNRDADRSIGSKVRLYSMGKVYKAGDNTPEVVQAIDSGFLRFNGSNKSTDMVFQNALASTMFYNSVYCIGGRATVRKINVVAGEGAIAPSYKWMSAVIPRWTDGLDRRSYTHILHPALDAAGVDRDFFDTDTLDDIVALFTESRDMKDVETRLLNLSGEELDPQTVKAVIDHSNTNEANLTNSNDFHSAPGLNLVATLGFLCDILSGDDE